jgi:hypothetical protein
MKVNDVNVNYIYIALWRLSMGAIKLVVRTYPSSGRPRPRR